MVEPAIWQGALPFCLAAFPGSRPELAPRSASAGTAACRSIRIRPPCHGRSRTRPAATPWESGWDRMRGSMLAGTTTKHPRWILRWPVMGRLKRSGCPEWWRSIWCRDLVPSVIPGPAVSEIRLYPGIFPDQLVICSDSLIASLKGQAQGHASAMAVRRAASEAGGIDAGWFTC